jgi:MFS family permease
MALWAYFAPSLESLFAGMFVMGCFASIYHPAGLALIAHETTPATRGAALGWHGIFGSLGIAAAPFMAALVFSTTSVTWRDYYLVLAAPGVVLAACLAWRMPLGAGSARQSAAPEAADSSRWRLRALCTLVAAGILSGIIYSAFTHFLPRYLDGAGLRPEGATAASFRTTLTALVLVCGAFGQALAGRLCRPDRLGWLLPLVLLAQVPCLAWMALAQGQARLWSTCAVAFVHFMQQPVYNSLIPRFVPARKLSLAFGFSNMMCFGLGAFGPTLAGMLWQQGSAGEAERWTYGLLAVVALASTAAAGAATGFSRQTERT